MNGRHWHRVAVVSPMKLAALVVVLSAMSLSDTRAEDASAKSQSQGSCMPIGLTASGEVVFPWDCRSIIEKQRGPVSVNVPSGPNDVAQKDQGPEKESRPEQSAASAAAAPVQPQLAVATPAAQDATAAAVHAVPHAHVKRTLAAVTPTDKKHQIAAQPQPAAQPHVSPITRALNALK
jgi:hypothetical protein